jgi:hypothetical protein
MFLSLLFTLFRLRSIPGSEARMNITIPEAIHICPGCLSIASGNEFCDRCVRDQERLETGYHAWRAHYVFSGQPRVTGLMPEDDGTPVWRGFGYGLLVTGCVGALVYWIWALLR